ncbi:hypothetical protein J6590_093075 [Homalodisca vitripennis]|nr:hypothetical protein J6590_093075 [Homalodisca vitripennis]
MFNLYINDVINALKCNHLLFADDIKLFMKNSTDHDAALLQEDINLLSLYLRDGIERVQRRFLRLAEVRLGFRYLDVPVQEISSYLNLPSLETRHSIQDVLFLYKLVNGIIDCLDLLQKINFQIPTGTRSRVLFARTSVTTSYAANSPVIRMQRFGCLLPEHTDFFCASLASFKRALCASQCLTTQL